MCDVCRTANNRHGRPTELAALQVCSSRYVVVPHMDHESPLGLCISHSGPLVKLCTVVIVELFVCLLLHPGP